MTPTTRIRILWAIFAVLALAGGLAAASPYLINTRVAKKEISKQISEWMGLPVSVRGEPVITVFPYLTVKLKDVEVQSNLGRSEPPLVSMEALRVEMHWLPLLLGNYEVRRFNLIKPTFEFARDKDGNSSWDMTGGSIVTTAPDNGRLTLAENITLGRFWISGGKLHYRDEATGQDENIDDIVLQFEWPSTEERATIEGRFDWRGQPISLMARSDKPTELFGGALSPLTAEISSPLFEMKGDGTAGTMANLQLEGDFSFKTSSLRDFLGWIDLPVGSVGGLEEASMTARANFAGESVAFSDLSLMLDGNRADGVIQLDFRRDRALVQGTLAGDSLDLTPYFGNREGEVPLVDQPLSLNDMGRADLDIRLSANQVVMGSMTLGRAAATLVTRDQQMSFSLGEAYVYGGRIEASLDMRPAKENSQLINAHLRGKTNGLLAGSFTREALQQDLLTGTALAEIDIQGEGRSLMELLNTSQGTASLVLTDGEFKRFNLDGLQDALELKEDIASDTLYAKSSRFDVLSIRGRMDDRILGIDGIRMTSGNRALVGTADLDLERMTLDFPGTLALYNTADPASQSTEDPVEAFEFRLKGPIANPTLTRRAKSDSQQPRDQDILAPGVPATMPGASERGQRQPAAEPSSEATKEPEEEATPDEAPVGQDALPGLGEDLAAVPPATDAPDTEQSSFEALEESVGEAAKKALESLLPSGSDDNTQ
ncbi:Uncharacterized protein involved in outer membrane biogenesis [Cohaesibacter sp. ES.047]|uniref:AsmA family protein n=1 Tax=Cohaesibacter sp. ES.047 TaxID=1798205 RepID=UPI000BB8A313|nr:AsmA family protein [Cohaesibacter sp. ES.047]SNY92486.1 Uncharacterized protein involved in outer membrane biogenesis [Cohaesibacter sp. ES.047]